MTRRVWMDIMTLNQVHIVVDQPVRFLLRSTDVIHDFNLPNFRVKQDVVPGMTIENCSLPLRPESLKSRAQNYVVWGTTA